MNNSQNESMKQLPNMTGPGNRPPRNNYYQQQNNGNYNSRPRQNRNGMPRQGGNNRNNWDDRPQDMFDGNRYNSLTDCHYWILFCVQFLTFFLWFCDSNRNWKLPQFDLYIQAVRGGLDISVLKFTVVTTTICCIFFLFISSTKCSWKTDLSIFSFPYIHMYK